MRVHAPIHNAQQHGPCRTGCVLPILKNMNRHSRNLAAAGLALALLAGGIGRSGAQTPAEAYAKGCGGCHTSERVVLRKIPRGTETGRRTWIETFMAQHPCERDSLKPLIVEYLLERTAR
ncbi:MAG: hypothetical protein FJX62_20965 [Alphaproteobacteria bacterium]|nr:hypothetical protein [Alphaproteobacteria bacterium]